MKINKTEIDLEVIVNRIKNGELDLQPDFQRGEIWDLKRKQRLIDTILRRWYIPAVHLVVRDGECGTSEIVLDGQQRLATIRDFLSDKFAIDGSIEPIDPDVEALHGKKYSQLPQHIQRQINRFELPAVRLSDYQPQEPNELFFRLNQSYNLTPPEKRNALHGKARDQVKEVVEKLIELGLLQKAVIGFSNGRLAYDDIVARTCVALEKGALTHHINNSVVEQYYREKGPFSAEVLDRVVSSGSLLLSQIKLAGGKVRFNKGTLQTWLVFCSWFVEVVGELPGDLLLRFENARKVVKSADVEPLESPDGAILSEIIRTYEDRASYRVTDVSSVVARDFCIYAFLYLTSGDTEDCDYAFPWLKQAFEELRVGERSLGEVISESNWGHSLQGKGPIDA